MNIGRGAKVFAVIGWPAFKRQSPRYIRAYRQCAAARIDDAPKCRRFPSVRSRTGLQFHLPVSPLAVVIFIRRTSESGAVTLLGHAFEVDPM